MIDNGIKEASDAGDGHDSSERWDKPSSNTPIEVPSLPRRTRTVEDLPTEHAT